MPGQGAPLAECRGGSLCRGMGHPSERTAKRASPLVREQRRDVRASEYPGAGAFRVAQAFPEVEGRILPLPQYGI